MRILWKRDWGESTWGGYTFARAPRAPGSTRGWGYPLRRQGAGPALILLAFSEINCALIGAKSVHEVQRCNNTSIRTTT